MNIINIRDATRGMGSGQYRSIYHILLALVTLNVVKWQDVINTGKIDEFHDRMKTLGGGGSE
jgi:hypothetical protein